MADAFEAEHEATYGHRYPGKKAVQFVSLRVTGIVASDGELAVDAEATLSRSGAPQVPSGERTAYFGAGFGEVTTPVLSRAMLTATPREGPLVIEEYEGTVVVPPAARASLRTALRRSGGDRACTGGQTRRGRQTMTGADLIVRGATVVDGTGRPPIRAHIVVCECRIADPGCFADSQGEA